MEVVGVEGLPEQFQPSNATFVAATKSHIAWFIDLIVGLSDGRADGKEYGVGDSVGELPQECATPKFRD